MLKYRPDFRLDYMRSKSTRRHAISQDSVNLHDLDLDSKRQSSFEE